MIFRQTAQIEHSGSMSGGHYWALCRRADGVYCLNDQSCTRVPGFAPPRTRTWSSIVTWETPRKAPPSTSRLLFFA